MDEIKVEDKKMDDKKMDEIKIEDKNLNSVEKNINSVEKNINLENNLANNLEKDFLKEVTLEISENTPNMELKNPKEVYMDIYNKALIKARMAKKKAIQSYLKANNIKKLYLLEDIESSDGEDLDNFSD